MSSSTETKRVRLLVVEDNRETRLLFQYMLQKDYDLEMAADFETAQQTASNGAFDLFVFDVNLSEQRTAVDLLRLLRKNPAHRATPAVAVTAYALPGDRDRFLEAGFSAYLSKPFTRKALLETIQNVLG